MQRIMILACVSSKVSINGNIEAEILAKMSLMLHIINRLQIQNHYIYPKKMAGNNR